MPKRYEVVGTQPVLEHQPGEKFTADVPADLEGFLVGIGGLKVLESQQAPAAPERGFSSTKADNGPAQRR